MYQLDEDTTWFGLDSLNITGRHNTVGETRTFNITANNTWYSLTEQLIQEQVSPDGSFVQRYRQNPATPVVKVPQAQGGGEYHGYWATLTAQQTVVKNETAISYYVYRCDIGVPFDTAPYHENSLRNVSTILTRRGKHTGVDIAPFSTTSLVSG